MNDDERPDYTVANFDDPMETRLNAAFDDGYRVGYRTAKMYQDSGVDKVEAFLLGVISTAGMFFVIYWWPF